MQKMKYIEKLDEHTLRYVTIELLFRKKYYFVPSVWLLDRRDSEKVHSWRQRSEWNASELKFLVVEISLPLMKPRLYGHWREWGKGKRGMRLPPRKKYRRINVYAISLEVHAVRPVVTGLKRWLCDKSPQTVGGWIWKDILKCTAVMRTRTRSGKEKCED